MTCYPNFIFIHIPKTGGTSIRAALGQSYFTFPGSDGHRSLDEIHEMFPPSKDWPSFTVIRDPFERIYSGFRWSEEDIWARCPARPGDITFSEWVHTEHFLRHYQTNHVFQPATRYLTTLPDFGIKFGELHDGYERLRTHCDYWQDRLPPFPRHKTFPHSNKSINSRNEFQERDVNDDARRKIRELYAEEYDIIEKINYI